MFSNGLSESARKRVELAVAVAQEKLLSDHVDHALDLVAFVNDDVTFSDALSIYTRLMRLDEDEAQNVRTRALAILGEEAETRGEMPEAAEVGVEEDSGRSWFRQITQRVKGRENEELRRRIELIASRTEVALLGTHVDNALNFVDFLEAEDEVEEQEAVELYLDALDVRESIAEVTYYMALSKIADRVLPERASVDRSAREAAGDVVEGGSAQRTAGDGEQPKTDPMEAVEQGSNRG